jgi:hypothetical protein
VCTTVPFNLYNLLNLGSLDLTAASRAYLLEPYWNPMVEEQALCRVHRVGQQRNVTTIRYLMRGSFEEVCSCSPDTVTDLSKEQKLILHSKL